MSSSFARFIAPIVAFCFREFTIKEDLNLLAVGSMKYTNDEIYQDDGHCPTKANWKQINETDFESLMESKYKYTVEQRETDILHNTNKVITITEIHH